MKNPFLLLVPALISMLLAPAAVLQAGEPEGEVPPLTPGQKVRFIAPGVEPRRFVGRILAVDGEMLTVKVGGTTLRARRDAIAGLEASKPTSRWKEGALVGGAALGMLMWLDNYPSDLVPGTERAAFGAVLGLVTGAIVGAMIEHDHWHPVSPERLRVNVGPVPGRGVGASVALRF